MNRKILYLFLALVLPGLIFIFLKRFGKNEFAIPVYYEENVDSLNNACNTRYPSPYRIPDSVLQRTDWRPSGPSLFVMDKQVSRNAEFKRLPEAFKAGEYQVIDLDQAQLSRSLLERWRSCVF